MSRDRKPILLRLDPAVHDALGRWASDEFRSLNAQVEMLLRHTWSLPQSAVRAAPNNGAFARGPDGGR